MNLLCPPADSETGEGLNPILEHLFELPACAQLIYKLLPEHIGYAMLQIIANDLDVLQSQNTKIESYEQYITKYLLPDHFTEKDKELLKNLKLNDITFLISLRKSFEQGPTYFSQVSKASKKLQEDQKRRLISIKQTFEINCYSDESAEFLLFNDIKTQTKFDYLTSQLLGLNSTQNAFGLLQQLLGAGMTYNGVSNSITEKKLSSSFLHFILSDRSEKALNIIENYMHIYDSSQTYEAFGKTVKEAFIGKKDHRGEEITQRQTENLLVEKIWQACFLIQLINFPIGAIVELPTEHLGPFALMIFCFEELGLLETKTRPQDHGEKLLIRVNPLLSVQQLPARNVHMLQQIRGLDLSQEIQLVQGQDNDDIGGLPAFQKRKKTKLYVENTGTIMCYGSGPETAVLARFCDVKCRLDHCTIFQLSRDKVRSCGASASRIARYLHSRSQEAGGVPPDIVNLLQGWEVSPGQLVSNVAVHRFHVVTGTPDVTFKNLLYVLIAESLAGSEILLFYHKRFVLTAQRCLGVARDVMVNGEASKLSVLKKELDKLNKYIQQEKLEMLWFVIVKAHESHFQSKLEEETAFFSEMTTKFLSIKTIKDQSQTAQKH